MAEPVELPEGAVLIGTVRRGAASVSLCDIGGVCWLYGLESSGEAPKFVTGLVCDVCDLARKAGYPSIFAETSRAQMLEVSRRYGFEVRTVVLEKTL